MEIHIEREMDGVGVVGSEKYNVEWREGCSTKGAQKDSWMEGNGDPLDSDLQ